MGVWAGFVAAIGTLVCCALPSFLVLVGLGTAVASAVSVAPWLVTLSEHKVWVFAAAGAWILATRLYVDRVATRLTPEGAACPPALARTNRRLWWGSVAVWVVGFLVAFGLGPFLSWLDG